MVDNYFFLGAAYDLPNGKYGVYAAIVDLAQVLLDLLGFLLVTEMKVSVGELWIFLEQQSQVSSCLSPSDGIVHLRHNGESLPNG